MTEKREAYNWPWILGTLIAGLALIGSAHLGDLAWGWPSITTGSIANVGAAFVIAFLLFVAERRFTRNVARRVETTVGAAAGQAARVVVAEETRKLGERVATLEDELVERRAATRLKQDERLEDLSNELSAENVWRALEGMIEVGAVRRGLTVSGTKGAPYPLVSFEIQAYFEHPSDFHRGDAEAMKRLMVSVIAEPDSPSVGTLYFGKEWEEPESFAGVVAGLDAQLRRGGRMRDAKMLDALVAAEQFMRAMRLVKDDQQAPLGAERLRGVLLELHEDDWAITTEGLQDLSGSLFLSWADLDIKTGFMGRKLEVPPAPDGVPSSRWLSLHQRLKHHAPGQGSSLF